MVSLCNPKFVANLNFAIYSIFNLRTTPIIWKSRYFVRLTGFLMFKLLFLMRYSIFY